MKPAVNFFKSDNFLFTFYFEIFTILIFLPFIFNQQRLSSFTNEWAVQINGNENDAKELAQKYGFVFQSKIIDNYYLFRHPKVFKRSIKRLITKYIWSLLNDNKVLWLEQQKVLRRVKRDVDFNDEMWPKMWYLNYEKEINMNVLGAWEDKYTGKNIVVTILDDGIEKDHPDLKDNYDAEASFDFNDNDPDPHARYDPKNENRHGTRCAGEVAAVANNDFCSVGVAHNARIGGIRMLDGDVSDHVEARSFSFNPQHIDIYSISWGPEDDGKTVDGPGLLAKRAFEEGIRLGRGGRGSIFIWASGNGGKAKDGCNCDGYTNNIYTLSISSVSESGQVPWYLEACPSTLATTFSSGAKGERKIVTTDLNKACTDTHTGTSASAPLAAGIAALVLEANYNLTWRDLQHIVVMTSRKANLLANDWVLNGANRMVSHHFGYGLMDTSAMIQVAEVWPGVPNQHYCIIKHPNYYSMRNQQIQRDGEVEAVLVSDACKGQPGNQVNYLEHVQAIVSLSSSRRGQIEIYLYSPQGTRSTLLGRRENDDSREGFSSWPFMTTHSWGEAGSGEWRLRVVNGDSEASLLSWSLVLYGTSDLPSSVKQLINKYTHLNNHYHHQHHRYKDRFRHHHHHRDDGEHYFSNPTSSKSYSLSKSPSLCFLFFLSYLLISLPH